MLRRKSLAVTLAIGILGWLPVRAQDEIGHSEVSVQAIGSFVKHTTDNGISQGATNSGGVSASYRYFFNRYHGVEVNYAYTLNTQTYGLPDGPAGVNANAHEVTAAYVFRYPVKRLTPFVLAGAGAIVFDPRNISSSSVLSSGVADSAVNAGTQARAAFVYGGGADFNVTHRIFFRAGYRGLVYNSPNFGVTALNVDRITHRAEPFGGFGVRF